MNKLMNVLSQYGFSMDEIYDITDNLQYKNIDVDNASKVLNLLKSCDILNKNSIKKKIAKIIEKCQYNDLLDIKEILDGKTYDTKDCVLISGGNNLQK